MSSTGAPAAAESSAVSHYLHPDFLEPLPSSLDPKQNPLVLLAQTCNNIGKDVAYANSKKLGGAKGGASGNANAAGGAAAAAESRMSSPPKLVSLKNGDEDKQPSSTSLDQRHSPTSTRSPKYAVTPEQAKSGVDPKALSPGQHLKENGARVVAFSPHREEKASGGFPSPRCHLRDSSGASAHLSGTSPIASAAAAAVAAAAAAAAASSREKATPPAAAGSLVDSKSPAVAASSQDLAGALPSVSSSFPFPMHHPAFLSAYSGMPWPTLPFPHLPSLPGLACPCGQCAAGGLASPGAGGNAGAAAPSSTCTAAGGCSPCTCAHCLSHPGAAPPPPQHSFLPDSFSSACFYSGLLNSYLGHVGANGHAKSAAAVVAAAAAAAAAAVPPPPPPSASTAAATVVTSSAPSSAAAAAAGGPSIASASSGGASRTVEYCMYCGKHCPSPEQLLAHLQTHMSASPESNISPPVSAPLSVSAAAAAAAPPGLGLYSSSAAADLLRKLYASSAGSPTPAAGLSPRFHPYRSFLPKLSPHRTPYQPFGTPLV